MARGQQLTTHKCMAMCVGGSSRGGGEVIQLTKQHEI